VTKLRNRPFALLGIHGGGLDAKSLKEVMSKENLPWRSFVDVGQAGAGPIARRWNLAATPMFFLLDHRGVIRRKWIGPPGPLVIDAAIDDLLRSAEKEQKPPKR
jgi:hypothetical protein